MLYSALHNRWLRLFAALAGEALIALGGRYYELHRLMADEERLRKGN